MLLEKIAMRGGVSSTATTADSAWASDAATGRVQSGRRTVPPPAPRVSAGDADGRAGVPAARGCARRFGLGIGEQIEPHDFAGGMAIHDEPAERVHLQRDRRPGQARAPADVPGGVENREFPFERRHGDHAAGVIGNGMRGRAAEMIRAVVLAVDVVALHAVREATRQNDRAVAGGGEPADAGNLPVFPVALASQPPRAGGDDVIRREHPISRRRHEHGTTGHEREERERLERFELSRRLAKAVIDMIHASSCTDADIATVRVDRQGKGVGLALAVRDDAEIGVEHP